MDIRCIVLLFFNLINVYAQPSKIDILYKKIDTIEKDYNYWIYYRNRCKLSSIDSALIDTIKFHMKTNRMNPQGIGEIRNFMESIIQDDETPYVLAKEIFNIYYSDKNFNVNNIVFILNASFLSKRYERNEYGGNLIYLCNDLFYDCLKNLEYRKMILEPTFLGGEYRKVSPTSYKLLFNSCKNQISIDEMIRKCKKRKNRSALIEIKKFINS